jgi:outer membrane protein TolC
VDVLAKRTSYVVHRFKKEEHMDRLPQTYWKRRVTRFRFAAACGLAAVSLLSIPGEPAWGQTQDGGRTVLSLERVIRMALAKSPEVAGIKSEIGVARSELEQVEAAYYPQMESVTTVGPVKNARRPVVIGERITDPSPDLSVGVFGSTDFAMTQPIYTFGKLSNRREAAARGLVARELKQGQKENEVALRVKELYYALVLARAGVEAATEALAYFDDARARMKRLLDAGSPNVLESDLYRIDAYAANTLRSRAEAQRGANIAYFALKSLIQLPPGEEFEPAEKMLSVQEERLGQLDAYIGKALADRPELKQLEQAIAAQQSIFQAARSDRYPSFFAALAGSVAGAPGRETFHNAYFPDQFNHAYVGVVGGLNWHFDFGIAKAKIEKEKAEYERLLHAKGAGRLNIPIEVVKYYEEAKEWRVAGEAYGTAATASRKWIVAALSNFDMGIGTADDMLRGMEKYGENRGKYLEAVFGYNMALAQLEYATGIRSW